MPELTWVMPCDAGFSGDRMHDAGTDCEMGMNGLVIKSMHCEIGPFE
jgi:hypothetical protein